MSKLSPSLSRSASALLAVAALMATSAAQAQLGLLDSSPPSVTIDAPASGAVLAGMTTIEATASDGLLGSGVSRVEYQVDGTAGAWTSLSRDLSSSRWKAQWNVDALSDGGHRLYVRARDNAGNVQITSVSVIVAVPPAAPLGVKVSAPPAPSNGGYLDVTWNANTEADLAGYFVYRSNAFSGPYARIATVSTKSLRDMNVRNGVTYFYRVSAYDFSGNESATSPTGQGTPQDTKAPGISGVSVSLSGSDRADVAWNTDEGATSQVLYGDTPNLGSSTTPVMLERMAHRVTIAGLEPATTYYYRARSVDAAGNAAVSEVRSFTTAPDLPPTLAIVSPTDGALIQGPSRMQVQASDDYEIAAVEYTFDGLQWQVMPFNSLSGYYEAKLDALPDGQHTIGARVSDEIGQTAQQAITITVDQHVPTVAWVYPVEAAHIPGGATYTFQVEANDGALAAVEWQVYIVPPNLEVEEAPPADPAAWQSMTYNSLTGYYEAQYTAPVALTEVIAFVYTRATDAAGKYALATREVSFTATGREFSYVGTGGQRLFGTVAIEPLGPHGENMIGIELRARDATAAATYSLTVSDGTTSHRISINTDRRGRAVAVLEEPTSMTDEFAATLTLTGPGF